MSRGTLSDLLRCVRLRGAVFFHVSFRGQWSAESSPAQEIAAAVLPGCEHVMEYHMLAKGNSWAAVSGEAPVKLNTGDIVMFPHGDRHVISSAPGVEPVRRSTEWVFAHRDDPIPIPVTFQYGAVDDGVRLTFDEADAILVCGFLGCDLRPFNPLITALPRILHLPASRAGE
jgi:Cupin